MQHEEFIQPGRQKGNSTCISLSNMTGLNVWKIHNYFIFGSMQKLRDMPWRCLIALNTLGLWPNSHKSSSIHRLCELLSGIDSDGSFNHSKHEIPSLAPINLSILLFHLLITRQMFTLFLRMFKIGSFTLHCKNTFYQGLLVSFLVHKFLVNMK